MRTLMRVLISLKDLIWGLDDDLDKENQALSLRRAKIALASAHRKLKTTEKQASLVTDLADEARALRSRNEFSRRMLEAWELRREQ